MKKLSAIFEDWELWLIPIAATLGFGVNLFYSSIVLTDGNTLLKDIRNSDFPILEAADKNINRFDAIVVSLNTAATTGELEFLDAAQRRAAEMQQSFAVLKKVDAGHKSEIEKLESGFNTYFALAIGISQQIATKTGTPGLQQISKMREVRDVYLSGSVKYRDVAKEDFHKAVSEAIRRSEHAKLWGAVIGILMLLVIIALTFLVMRDIAKRKQMVAALRDSEEASRIAATAFETHDGIAITDVNAHIIRVNRAFTAITGYSQDEVLGKNPSIMKSDRHDASFYNEMWQQLLRTGIWSGEIWNQRKNGEVYPKSITISAVKNARQEITHYVAIFSDITERKQNEQEIRNLAFYDVLTQLPNRRLFLDRFQIALSASARHNNYGAVLYIDLDRFKALNDTLGHDYGDLLLIEVGVRIKSCIRDSDMVARIGGDEFVVLIEACSADRDDATQKVLRVAEKIRETLSQPYMLKEHQHHSSPSIGISLYHGHDESYETVLKHADMAMYQVKMCGRNSVRFFDPSLQQHESTQDERGQV
jgi:diguanylate cyclase (GGDEF)-like protein/PAS domain S-box-containing protein